MSQNKRESVEDYLLYLENKGIEKGYFEMQAIKDIGKSCCLEATTQVIDFDKTKEKLVAQSKLVTTKSCDCLKIRADKQCLDLIEMKGFAESIKYYKGKKIDEKLTENVKKFDLEKKIEDSLHLLETLVRKEEFQRNSADAQFFRETKINYIVLTDVDRLYEAGFSYFSFVMYFLSEHSDTIENHITSELNKELSKIPNLSHKLNEPMLKTCGEIDAYYAL